MLKLSDRLEKICNHIEQGETVADIGTDHGLLPLALFEKGISPYLILTDIKPGPLEKVRVNLDRYFLHYESQRQYVIIDKTDKVPMPPGDVVCFDIRMGSGLEVLNYSEVDTVVIAGIGGPLIIELLGKDQRKARSFNKFILQPRVGADKLRRWLYENEYHISCDELAMEYGRINEIITVCLNCYSATETPVLPLNFTDCIDLLHEQGMNYEISDGLLRRCDPLLPAFLREKIERCKTIISNIEQFGHDDSKAELLTGLMKSRDIYITVLEIISACPIDNMRG